VKIKGIEKYEFYSSQLQCHFSFNPTQPNQWMDPTHVHLWAQPTSCSHRLLHEPRYVKKNKRSPCSITERRVPELFPVLGSQPAGDVSHKPGGRLPLLSAEPAVTLATLNMAAINVAAW